MSEWQPGDDPMELWTPGLGHVFGLRPCDMRDLTPYQMGQIKKYAEKLSE